MDDHVNTAGTPGIQPESAEAAEKGGMNNVISISGGKDSTAMLHMMLERGEEWIDVPGFEGMYQVSSLGEVKSLNRFDTKMKRHIHGRTLKPGENPGGYLLVVLSKDGKRRTVYIHQLVCAVFYRWPKQGEVVMHLNGNNKDNRASNLRYGSQSCNMALASEDGTTTKGERNRWSKLTEENVLEIRQKYIPRKVTFKMLANEYGVCPQVISKVIYRQTWTHI